jgi:hypothetical protein
MSRARWQIELLFKRIKQLVRIHRLRSSHPLTNEATLTALLVGWALVERQAGFLRDQVDQQEAEPTEEAPAATVPPLSTWQIDAVLVQSLRSMILGRWTWRQIQQQLHQIRYLLASPQEDRVHQESSILQRLDSILAAIPSGGSLG